MADQETRDQLQRVETLIQRFDESTDPNAKADAAQLVQALMDLHGAAFNRIVTVLMDQGETGHEILARLGQDPATSSLLILYNLHPVPLTERVRKAAEDLQPFLKSQQATLELTSIENGAVRLRLLAEGHGCHSTTGRLRQVVEDAIIGAAPDLVDLAIDELSPQPKPVFVQLESLRKRKPAIA